MDLPVSCVAHPGIQPWDTVTVSVPTPAGDVDLVGQVSGMTLWSAGAVPAKRMDLSVRVGLDQLEALATAVRRG